MLAYSPGSTTPSRMGNCQNDIPRERYGDGTGVLRRFLGFDEAFSYPSPSGTVVSFKINDRQFLEFIVDKQAKEKKRLVSVSLETESVPVSYTT